MKRTITAIMMLMLVISLFPLALAEENEISQETETEINVDAEEDEVKVEQKSRVKVNGEEQRTEIKEQVKNGRVERRVEIRETIEQRAGTTIERVREIRQKIEIHRGKVLEAREEYHSQREALLRLKEKVNLCKDDGNCTLLKEELKLGIRLHLLKTGDLINASLARLESQLAASEEFDEAEKQQALETLSTLEETLNSKMAEVKALSENATNEELREAIRELKDTWKEVRKEQRKVIVALLNSKLDNLDEKHQRFAASMEKRVAEISDLGGNTAKLEELLAQYQENQKVVAEKIKRAKSDKTAVEEVKQAVQESKQLLREFVQEYKEQKRTAVGNQETVNETSEEVENDLTQQE